MSLSRIFTQKKSFLMKYKKINKILKISVIFNNFKELDLFFYTKNIILNVLLDFSPSVFRFDTDSQQLFIQNMSESFKIILNVAKKIY